MKDLIKGGALVFCATLVWQFSNFAFNVVGAHELGPEMYGVLAAAMGLSYLLNPIIQAVQTVASRESTSVIVDDQASQIRAIVNYYLLRVGGAAVALAALVIVLSPLISRALRLNSAVLVAIFGLVIPTLVATGIVRGVHQGTRRFGRYALGTIAEGVTKITAAVAFLILVSRAPVSGMLALLASAVVALAVNVVLLRHFPKSAKRFHPVHVSIRYSLSTFIVFGLQAILLSVDTIAARLTLPAHSAGVYAGISLAGKIVYFATTALTAFLFPIFSARIDRGLETRRWLWISMILVATVSSVVVAFFSWAPYLVTKLLLGSRYNSIALDIRIMGGIFAIYAMAMLLATYLLARRQRGISIALALAVAVQIGGFAMFHGSVNDLMRVEAAAFTVAFIGCGTLVLLSLVPKARHARIDANAGLERAAVRSFRPAYGGRHRASGPPVRMPYGFSAIHRYSRTKGPALVAHHVTENPASVNIRST